MPSYPGSYVPPTPPTPASYPPVITTVSLPAGAVGTAYADTLGVVYGTYPYTFAVTAGSLPAGVTLSAAGTLSGTPTASGAYAFVVTVTDANAKTGSASLTLSIPSVPSIQQTSLPLATVGIPFYASLTGSGGASPYGFQVSAGALPTGLTLATTGGITGTPTTAGTVSFTVQIYDSGSPQGTGTTTFQIIVQAASLASTVRQLPSCVLLSSADGGLYAVVPGQKYDTDINGNQIGITQKWWGVPTSSPKQAEMQLGGATVSAKGSGNMNITVTDDYGNITYLTSERRPMRLNPTKETRRDFMVKGAPKSPRFAPRFDNGGVVGAWFQINVGILWIRQFFTGGKG